MAAVYRGGQPYAEYQAILADTGNHLAFASDEAPIYYGGESFGVYHVPLIG